MRLLLIEDDVKAARLLAKGLREEGWVVDVAATGEAGEELAGVNAYDAIVLDPRGVSVRRQLFASP